MYFKGYMVLGLVLLALISVGIGTVKGITRVVQYFGSGTVERPAGPVPVATVAATPAKSASGLTKERIAAAFDGPINSNQFPPTLDISVGDAVKRVRVEYSLDTAAQAHMEKLFASYKPDYGAFVALDAATGRILSLVSYTRDPSDVGNLTLRSTFPAASVFKIVTATAAIDQHKMNPDSLVPYTGGLHTLYKRNVSTYESRAARHMTLREAFAKSVNTVFAKIGLFVLNPLQLVDYAKRFQFNQLISADVPVQPGRFVLADNDKWAMAEAASGFDKMILMSPVQGAMMAASVVNDGEMMAPYLVDTLLAEDTGVALYHVDVKPASHTMAPSTAAEIRKLMRETVQRGTSRRAFRDFWRRKVSQSVEVGGKTGSLTGIYPKGKYDWFVGYALGKDKRIAVAALTINEENWRVKSSYLARSFVETYFTAPSVPH